MLIKSLEDDDLNESFESTEEEENHQRSSRELDVHKEIVRVLVSCLDYRTQSDNLVLWTYLSESLKFLCFRSPDVTTFTRDLYRDRNGWWSKQNFRNEAQCSDEVIVKKAIICVMLHGCEEPRFKTILQNIEERKTSAKSSYFVNLAKELDSVVSRITSPLLTSFSRPILVSKSELREEWAKIKMIRATQEPQGRTKNTKSSKKKK